MNKQTKNKVRRIFASILAIALMTGTLPGTPFSGVIGDMAVTANAEENEITEIEISDWNALLDNADAAEVTTENYVTTVKLKSCIKTTHQLYISGESVDNYVLDLNGYGIRYSGEYSDSAQVIRTYSVDFTLEDSDTSNRKYYLINQPTGKTSSFRTVSVSAVNPGGTADVDYAEVTGGYITGGYTQSKSGAGIEVGGNFVMKGGTIIGNYSSVSNLGVGLLIGHHCTFTMHGGSIRLNGRHNGDSCNVANDGTLYVKKGLTVESVYGDMNYFGYNITTNVQGQGTVTAEPTTKDVDGQTYTVSGKPVSLTVTPDDGWRLTGLSAVYSDDIYAPLSYDGTTGKYAFTMPDNDVTVSAYFEQYHTVTFNVNGNTTNIYPAHGAVPVYDEDTPTKDADAQYTYTFSGWSDGTNTYGINDTLPAVTADVTYTAVFSTTTNKYTVTWMDGDVILKTDENVPYGTTLSIVMPVRTDTPQYSYTFNGWNDGNNTYPAGNLPTVSGNVTYMADFTQTVNKYTVTLPANMAITNNVTLTNGKADYGTVIKFAPAYAMTVSGDVTANGTVLTPDENGDYTVNATENITVSAQVKRNIDLLTDIVFEDDVFNAGLTYSYDGASKTPAIVIEDFSDNNNRKTLESGTDYTVSYSNNTGLPDEAVTATVTITGIGDYAGTATKTFRISPFSISDAACTIAVPDQIQDGWDYIFYKFEAANNDSGLAKKIDAVVKYGNKDLTPGIDYTFGQVVSADGKEDMPGSIGDQCQVEIIGKGDYIGQKLSNVFTIISPAGNGTLGGLTWVLADGKLTITGSGAMPEYSSGTQYNWFRFASYITEIEIGEGVTSVAANAFEGNSSMIYYGNVNTVTLPSTVTSIGDHAFAYMTGIETIDLSHVTTIGSFAFNQCKSLEITVPVTVTSLEDDAFSGCENVSFTITWKNDDGNVLATVAEKFSYDNAPSYSGDAPTKPADMQYTYTFSGWSPEPVPAQTNKTYTAQYSSMVNQYAVTFKDPDGSMLDILSFDYGTKPVYPIRIYHKISDQYSDVIASWTDGTSTYAFDNLPTVMGEAVYTAIIAQEENRYTVTWQNWDGTVLETDENVLYNTLPDYNGETPTKTITWEGRTDVYHFIFAGWDKTVVPVSDDVIYTAQFSCENLDSYMDGDTLVLKGNLAIAHLGNSYHALLMPLNAAGTVPVNREDVIHIRVDEAGATFPADSARMFLGFYNVTDIDLTGADTSNVTDMNNMFYYCNSLTDLDISGFDTSKVTDLHEMFGNCFAITEIDLSAFDTGSVTDIQDMFSKCRKLQTIYVGNKWTTESITNKSRRVFSECINLTGEHGSVCTSAYSDANYACIDGGYGSSQRGYLTSKYYVNITTNGDYCTADRSFVTGKAGNRLVVISPKTGYALTGLTVMCGDTPVSAVDGGDGTFSFYMQREDAVVTAVIEAYTPVVINYVDINGITTPTTVYKEIYTGADYMLPDTAYLDGYTFTGWKVNDIDYTTNDADAVKSAVVTLVKEGTDVTVQPVYTKKETTYHVSIGNGHFKDSTVDTGDYTPATQLYAVANDGAAGQIFRYWTATDSNGKTVIVSYDEIYAFRMPTKDITLSAVYGDTSVEENAKVGTAYIESVTKTGDDSISFVAISSVPDGATMKRTGIVACKGTDLNSEHTAPRADYARFIKYNDTTCQKYSTFKYTWTKGNILTVEDEWCVCAYMVYTDKDNVEHTIYSDMVRAKLNDFTTS